jgi:hypothetical protein
VERSTAGRRPWVVALVFFLICTALTVLAPAPAGVYAMEGNLVFIPPNAVGGGNALRADSARPILFAAAVERAYNVTPQFARVASTNATLYGIGVRDGSRVTLPDRGGQWGSSFDRPYLRVEVVSRSPEETQARFERIVTQIRAIASGRQQAAAVPKDATVALELSPTVPVVQYVSGRHGPELVAGVLLGALGAGAIVTLGQRRRRTRPEPGRLPSLGGVGGP